MLLKSVVICIVSVSVVFVIAYIIFEEAVREKFFPSLESCDDYGGTCVRFCCFGVFACGNETDIDISGRPETKELSENYRVLRGKPCTEIFPEYDDATWGFYANGHVFDGYNETYDWNNYCVFANSTNIYLNICAPKKAVKRIQQIYPYLMIASIPFLVATFFVYGCIRELRNLHGKSLMAYVLSLTLMYASMAVILLYDRYLYENYLTICKIFGHLLMMSTFTSFFWLNVMCFDIWTTFKGKGIRSDKTKKFLKYCIYAFGVPLLLVSIVFILNEFQLVHSEYSSRIGNGSCTVTDPDLITEEGSALRKRQLIYIYAPICLFIVVNTIFYAVTAWKIYRVQKETSIVKRGDSNRHAKKEKARFFLYMRLFVIMGLPWVIEIVSWYAHNSIILNSVAVINCLQGFVIFMLFVWQSKVQKMLERRYNSVSQTLSMSMSSRRSQNTKSESLSLDGTKKNSLA